MKDEEDLLNSGQMDEPYKDPVVEAYRKDVDVTLIRENLKLSVEERLKKLMRMQEFIDELRRATREATNDRLSKSSGSPCGSGS